MRRTWDRLGGVRPHAEGGSCPLSARPGGLLVRRARVAARQGPRLLGLPCVLPAAVRVRPRRWTPSSSSERRSHRSCSGCRWTSAAPCCSKIVLGLLYAASIVAWSATALTFGRVPALLSALLLLVYPAYATLYHQASSDAIFATGLAFWALGLARTLSRPSGWRFAALGAGIAILVLIRPANQVLLPIVLLPAARPDDVEEAPGLVCGLRRRRSSACSASGRCTTGFATTTRRSRAADAPGSRSYASSSPTRPSRRRTARRRSAFPA